MSWVVVTDAHVYWTGAPEDRRDGVRYPWSEKIEDAFVFRMRTDAERFAREHCEFCERPPEAARVEFIDERRWTENELLWRSWHE